MDRFYYRAFDQIIASDLELPELPAMSRTTSPTLEISLGTVTAGQERTGWQRTGDEFVLWWSGVASFSIGAGRIIVDPASDCPSEIVRLPVLGPAMAVALQLTGLVVLHGNAVDIDGKAFVMAGDKGCGKSTLTATLLARGHRLLADDVVVLRQRADGSFSVLPGFPAMKLWPDTLHHCGPLGIVHQRLLTPGGNKLCVQLAERHFADQVTPLGAIAFLGRGSQPEATPLSGPPAFPHLMQHSYCSRYGQAVLGGTMAAHHLRKISALLSSTRISFLRRSDDFMALASLAELAETACDRLHSRKVAA